MNEVKESFDSPELSSQSNNKIYRYSLSAKRKKKNAIGVD